ncbi:MAG: winged helix-turn-helix domain-containing protein [Actinomycetota bacterium]
MTRILIVEDEIALAEPLAYLLELEGYETAYAADGNEGVRMYEADGADMILLDLMLPGRSGTEVCRHIRRSSSVPIIMLTAKDSEVDTIVGLELGADDYVTKPYSTRELIARIRAVLRRRAVEDEADDDSVVEIGRVRLDADSHTVTVAGEETAMPLREFELLEYLMRNAGRVLTRSQLIDRVWGSDYFGDTKTLDVHVKRLRAKIEEDPANPTRVVTLRGLGYRFER